MESSITRGSLQWNICSFLLLMCNRRLQRYVHTQYSIKWLGPPLSRLVCFLLQDSLPRVTQIHLKQTHAAQQQINGLRDQSNVNQTAFSTLPVLWGQRKSIFSFLFSNHLITLGEILLTCFPLDSLQAQSAHFLICHIVCYWKSCK